MTVIEPLLLIPNKPSCLVPQCDGIRYANLPTKEGLWDRYYTGVPRRRHIVRTAIQRSKATTKTLAAQYGINQKTVAKWRKRNDVHDAQMGPKKPASTVLTTEEEAHVCRFSQTYAPTVG